MKYYAGGSLLKSNIILLNIIYCSVKNIKYMNSWKWNK